jgi:hypothetical protein
MGRWLAVNETYGPVLSSIRTPVFVPVGNRASVPVAMYRRPAARVAKVWPCMNLPAVSVHGFFRQMQGREYQNGSACIVRQNGIQFPSR